MYYPSTCFCIREDVTKESRKAYRAWKDRVWAEILRLHPDYLSIPTREQWKIREAIESYVK